MHISSAVKFGERVTTERSNPGTYGMNSVELTIGWILVDRSVLFFLVLMRVSKRVKPTSEPIKYDKARTSN